MILKDRGSWVIEEWGQTCECDWSMASCLSKLFLSCSDHLWCDVTIIDNSCFHGINNGERKREINFIVKKANSLEPKSLERKASFGDGKAVLDNSCVFILLLRTRLSQQLFRKTLNVTRLRAASIAQSRF